jgi:lysophospholipase L1-like esterase
VNFTTNEKTTAYLHISLNGLGTDGNKSMVFLDDLLVTTLVEDIADDTEESLLAGDVNGDKITNLKDLIILAQYLAKWQNVTVDTNLADVNADGEADMGDLNNLARYLAGWKNVAVKGDGYMNFAPAEHSLKDIKSNLKFNSRATFVDNKLRMEWSASGFTVQGQFRGDFVLTDIKTSKEVLLYAVLDNDYDNPKQLRITSGNLTALTNIEPGFHTIQILKATEAAKGVITIGGISYTGALFTAPAEKDLKIQFIGDSITSASGLYTATVQPDSLLRNDITKGYAYKVAKHFNAELSIVSVSGGTICTNSPSLQDYYQRALYTSSTSVYDFSAETKPDLVVVALGTNDTPSYLNGNQEVLANGIKNMLTLVRKNNPNAAILWAYGMMDTRIDSVYKNAVNEFAATDGNTFYTLIGRNDCTGSGGHPTPNGHTLNANEYIAFIEGNIW